MFSADRQQGQVKDPEPRRKPEGGFAFFSVMQLVMAWTGPAGRQN